MAGEPPSVNKKAPSVIPSLGNRGSAAFRVSKVGTGTSPRSSLKQKLKTTIANSRHDVTAFYHTTGFCQRIARAQWFDNFILSVISFNAIWIWIDVDYNEATSLFRANPIFVVVELFFAVTFSFEWMVRFGAFCRKPDCFKDAWFLFDSTLVFLMVFEISVLSVLTETGVINFGDELGKASILRLLRLLRLTRIGKLMSYVPEIMIMIKGLVEGMRSVGLTMVLLALIIYVVAVALTQIARDTEVGEQYFKTVPDSMYSLLIHGMVPDIAGVMDDMKTIWYIGAIFLFFVFFSTFTIMNMLIGILCEVVSSVKSVEKEQMDVEMLQATLRRTMDENAIDEDHDGLVSKAEFLMILEKPRALKALGQMGFDVVALVDFAEVLFGDDPNNEVALTFAEFLSVLLQSRSTQPATQKDVRDLETFILKVFDEGRRANESKPVFEEPKPLPSDAATILLALHELRQRVDGLETLITTSAESQRSLEGLVVNVMATQKQLLDRLPSAELLSKLSEGLLSVPNQATFQPQARVRRVTPRSPIKMDNDPCQLLFCAGGLNGGQHPLPTNALRGLPFTPLS